MKTCSKCKKEYPVTEEYFSKNIRCKDGFDSWCKGCYKEYRKKNPDYMKKYYKENREKFLGYYYGITLEEYNQMLKEQNHCCAICKKHENEFKRKLDTDHDHKTGKIRGILCFTCNTNLGIYEKWYKKYKNIIEKYLKN